MKPKKPSRLSGRLALVTGANRGIGLEIALALAEEGCDLVITGRDERALAQAHKKVEKLGVRVLAQTCDVRNPDSVDYLFVLIRALRRPLDFLVNNAGVAHPSRNVRDLPYPMWMNVIDTNLTGTLRACQVFGRHMLERGYGRIVNIASLNSFVALNEVAAYAASKAGVASLTRSLAVEWSKRGVTVNAIAPGVFRTELNADLLDSTPRGQELLMRTPMGRFGKTEELIGAAIYLASDAASFVTGQTLVVDGGFLASGVNQ